MTLCRHCQARKPIRGGALGLCRACWDDRRIRDQYPVMVRSCQTCGTAFRPEGGRGALARRYCSDDCLRAARKGQNAATAANGHARAAGACGRCRVVQPLHAVGLCAHCYRRHRRALEREGEREPTEAELEATIAEQRKRLPPWWPPPGEQDHAE